MHISVSVKSLAVLQRHQPDVVQSDVDQVQESLPPHPVVPPGLRNTLICPSTVYCKHVKEILRNRIFGDGTFSL